MICRRVAPLIASGLMSVCMSSCGGNSQPAAITPLSPTLIPQLSSLPNHNLNWEGTTSDGLGAGFQISGNHVTGIYIELPEVQGDVCVFGVGGFSLDGFDNFDLVWGRAGPPIKDGAFTVVSIAPMSASIGTNQMSASVDFTLSGTVNASSGDGMGNFRFSTRNASASCAATKHVTWSIARTSD
jgi:hypothetical protein